MLWQNCRFLVMVFFAKLMRISYSSQILSKEMKSKALILLFLLGIAALFFLKQRSMPWYLGNRPGFAYSTNVPSNLSKLHGFLSHRISQTKYRPIKDQFEQIHLAGHHGIMDSIMQQWSALEKTKFQIKNIEEWLVRNVQLYLSTQNTRYLDDLEFFAYNFLLDSLSLNKTEQDKGATFLPPYYAGSIQDTLIVNFYEAGAYVAKLNIGENKKRIKYYLDTNYPLDGTIELSLFPGKSQTFTISLRVPGWCAAFTAHINNDVYKGKSGNYLRISRTWHKGDVLRICMDMEIQQSAVLDSFFLQRGPQILVASSGSTAFLEDQKVQKFSLNTVNGKVNAQVSFIPFATACQSGEKSSIFHDSLILIQELPSNDLSQLRTQLAAFRDEFGGTNDMPDVPFFLFGMGNRPKYIYKDGQLKQAISGKVIRQWAISHQSIIPNAYQVNLRTLEGDSISIYENENGIYIKENDETSEVLNNTTAIIKLPQFQDYKYDQILRVLHQEILINIVESQPLPNFLAYDKAWRRDAAMMAMCLEKTGNLELIRDWVLALAEPYDYNNQTNGVAEEEADNLGQTLYLLSLFTNKDHPLVSRTLEEIPKFEKARKGKKFIKGRTDFGYQPAYQTKWLKFGLKAMDLPDSYEVPLSNDGYNTLFWWDYKNPEQELEKVEVWRYYPYISWAKDHYFGSKNSPISNRDYPLTWEIEASHANYEKMKMIDYQYYLGKNASPHTWHTAEVFLYLLEFKK